MILENVLQVQQEHHQTCIPIDDTGECPPGTTGTPPDCISIDEGFPPGECPEGQVGTPPDCETPPGILPPPENGDEGGGDEGGGDEGGGDEAP
jgi:hypothetical protein